MASSEISSFGCVAIARASSILRNSTWLSFVADTSAFDARPICVRIDIMVSRRCAAETSSPWRREVERDHQVFGDRHAPERPRDLEAARDAAARAHMRLQPRDVLAAEHHGAGLGTERAGNAVDQRGLSRAVRADQAEALSRTNLDADIVERGEAAEALCQRR